MAGSYWEEQGRDVLAAGTSSGGAGGEAGAPEPPATYAAPQADGAAGGGAGPAAQAARPTAWVPPADEYASAAPVRPRKARWWIPLVVVLAILVVLALAVTACVSSMSQLFGGDDAFASGATEPDSVAIIQIAGEIAYDGSECSPEGLKELLDQASDDDDICAVVLRVNSGGGTATAGEEMATYVREFDKPVVVSSASINASAAYELSSQADYIFAAKTSEVGAIGTNLSMIDYSELLDKLGIKFESFSSSPEKDSSYGRRELTDEERELYQQLVFDVNEAFVENVAEGRGMSMDDVRALANGMPYAGSTCVENGLVDRIGTLEDACAKAAELAGVDGDFATCDLYLHTAASYSLMDLLGGYAGGSSSAGDALRQLGTLYEEMSDDDGIAR